MSLTVLSDEDVKKILENLTKEEVARLQIAMSEKLHEYATGTTNSGAAAENQPKRTVIESRSGTTTLFMPSTSSSGIGMKVVTLGNPAASHNVEASIFPQSGSTSAQGALTIMEPDGRPYGFVNAEEVTAFRTALSSSLLISRRTKVKTIVVFGSGKQAYWHVRLALILKGPTIKRVHFINREFNDRAANIMKSFISCSAETKQTEGWSNTTFDITASTYHEYDRIIKEKLRKADLVICSTPSTEPLFDHTILTNTEGRKRSRLIIAIGSYKAHMVEIPPEVVAQAVKVHGHGHHYQKRAEEGGVIVVDTIACVKEAGELVQAGVTAKQTVELGELVMLEHMEADESSIDDDESSRPSFDDTSPISPQDPVSSLAKALRGSGIDGPRSRANSQSPSRRSSRGSFSLSRKPSASLHRRTGSVASLRRRSRKNQTEKEDEMSRWLNGGNVIYKSVGLGLMDLVMGGELVKLAREKNVGTTVENF